LDGTKVLIDSAVLEKLDAHLPRYMTRTAWINHLLDRAATQIRSTEYPSALAVDA
jgi:hypothetical protein